jgi:predicted molibdopterin-dependent oxidoreductase YjgC
LGTDIYEEMPVHWLRVRKGIKNGAHLVVANPRATEADRLAYHRLRYRPRAELAVLRGVLAALVEHPPMEPAPPAAEGQPAPEPRARDLSGLAGILGGTTVDTAAQESGVTAETLRAVATTLAGARNPLIYAGARLATRADADQIAAGLVNLAAALGNRNAISYFAEGANARGAEFAGLVPDEGGLPAGEIIAQAAEGQIKALYLVGENVLATHPAAEQARRALRNAELIVVHELFPTETAREADIVFSACSIAEKDGTMTNAEGRVQRLFRALRSDAAGVRPDWRILSDLSGEMGEPLGYAAAAEVTHDLFADLPAYASIGSDAIPVEGVIAREEGGTLAPALSQGEREYAPLPAREAARRVGEGSSDGGLILLAYSELLGDETTLLATPELMAMVPVPYVELNRADAQRLGLANGDWAELRTEKGAVQRVVRVNGRCPQGVCFSPDNLGQPRINEILDWSVPQPAVQITAVPAPAVVGAAAAEMAGAGD